MSKDKKLLDGSEMTQNEVLISEDANSSIPSTPIEAAELSVQTDSIKPADEAVQDEASAASSDAESSDSADLPPEPVRVIPKRIDVTEALKNPIKRKGPLPNIVEKLRDNKLKYGTTSLSRFSAAEEKAFNDRRSQVAFERLKNFQKGIHIPDDDPYDRETLNFQESYVGAYAQYRLPSEVEALDPNTELDEPKVRVPNKDYILNENRNMTVIFCDLVNSSKFVDKDSEEAIDLMRRFQKIGGESMEAHGGQINTRNGDGFVCTFGFRLADENETLRAIKAALLMLEKAYDDPDVNIRIAIHLGNVSTGMDDNDKTAGGNKREVLGRTVHECARMEGVADPNTVCVSEGVANLLCEFFHFELIENRFLKGFGYVPLFQAVEPTAVNTRFDVQVKKGLTPFVCQAGPYDRLQDLWDDLPKKGPQFLTIEGNPGVGKSRLVHEFMGKYKHDHTVTHYIGYCMVERRQVPFGVFMAMMEGVFAFKKGASESEKITRVEEVLQSQDLERVMPVWINMLKLKPSEYYLAPKYTYGEEQEIFMKSMMDWMVTPRAAIDNKGKDPYKFVLQIENFEHVDHSSWELLEYLIDHMPGYKQFLLILNVRTDQNRYNSDKLETLCMGEWSEEDSIKILKNVYKNYGKEDDLTPELQEQLLKRSGYNPLFIEDLSFFYIDGPTGLETIKNIPLNMNEILTYRIMRLGAERNLLKQASLFGEHIPVDFLAYNFEDKFAKTKHEGKFYQYLELLLKDGIIEYSLVRNRIQFRHGLHQEATVHTFRRENWKAENLRIADNLIDFYGKKANYVAVATYYAKGMDFIKSIHYYEQGGFQLEKESAYDEIIDALPTALEIIHTEFTDNEISNNQELNIRFSLAKAYAVEGGEESIIFDNLRLFENLVVKLSKSDYNMFILVEKARLHMTKNRFEKALECADQLIDEGLEENNWTMLMEGLTSRGIVMYYMGNMKESEEYIEMSADLATNHEHSSTYSLIHPSIRALSLAMYPAITQNKIKTYKKYKDKALKLVNTEMYSKVNECYAISAVLFCSTLLNDRSTIIQLLKEIHDKNDETTLNIMKTLNTLFMYWTEQDKPHSYLNDQFFFKDQPYIIPFEMKIKVDLLISYSMFSEAHKMIKNHFKQEKRSKFLDPDLLALEAKILLRNKCYNKGVKKLYEGLDMAKQQNNLFFVDKIYRILKIIGVENP